MEANTREYFGVVKGIDRENRTVSGYASTGEIDRYGEVVDPSAFKDLDRFLTERHLFAAGHRYVAEDGSPTIIGKVLDAKVDGKGLQATFKFDDDPLAQKWFDKYASGTIRSFSIGFIPKAYENRQMKVNGTDRQVRVYTDVELLEISAVPIPANRESIVTNAAPEQLTALARTVDEIKSFVEEFANQVMATLGVLTGGDSPAGGDEPAGGAPSKGSGDGLLSIVKAMQ